jgi:hypothetical protein
LYRITAEYMDTDGICECGYAEFHGYCGVVERIEEKGALFTSRDW